MKPRIRTACVARSPLRALISSLLLFSACVEDQLPTSLSASPGTAAAFQIGSSGDLRAYVTNFVAEEISVIRVADNSVMATVPVDVGSQHVATTPDGRFVYVTHSSNTSPITTSLSVIRTRDHSVVATLPKVAGQDFNATTITSDGAIAYVTNGRYEEGNPDTYVQVLRTADNAVFATIGTGPHVMGALTSDDAFLYLTGGCGSTTEPCVRVVRTTDNSIVASIPVAASPNRIVLTSDDSRAYVSHSDSDVITIIRTFDNSVEATFDIPASLGLALSPDGRRLYVTNDYRDEPGTVTVVRTSDHLVETVFNVGDGPESIALTPDGSLAYVTNSGGSGAAGTVSVVRTADHAILATIPVGRPTFVSFALVPSAQDEIAGLQDAIGDLEASARLNRGSARALQNHLDNAISALERGQTAPAVAQLEAFISQVQQFVTDGVLTEAEAAPLIAAAESAIASIQAGA